MDMKVIIIIALLLIICIGGYVSYKQFKKNKKENSFATVLFSNGMLLIVSSSISFFDKVLVGVAVIAQYDNAVSLAGEFNKFYFGLGCALILFSVALHLYSRKKLYVLNINGYSNMRVESYIPTIKVQNSDFKEREIDFNNIYQHLFSVKKDIDSFECIKAEIRDKVTAFRNETSKITKGYTGIAPIPFIMYAGTFLNRVKIDEYYEYDKIKTKTYYTLKDKKILNKYPELKDRTNFNNFNENKSEIVVAVSLTRRITDSHLNQFIDRANVVKIEVNNPNDNIIKYKQQLDDYVNFIMDKFEQLTRDYSNTTKIHFVYSGQSCLAFEIGKRCVDSTRIPQVISYQFENQNQIKYPWGMVINGSHKGDLVRSEVAANNV
jgi:hypothetical protein